MKHALLMRQVILPYPDIFSISVPLYHIATRATRTVQASGSHSAENQLQAFDKYRKEARRSNCHRSLSENGSFEQPTSGKHPV
jgi:hypothetical protein